MSTAIIERLRETLEAALPRGEAAAVVFGALARWGPRIPGSESELAAFVSGALRDELGDRVRMVSLAPLLRELADVIATAGAPTADHEIPIEIVEPATERDEPSTKTMRSCAGPVPVLVIASSPAFALRLRLALGETMIVVESRADLVAIERALANSPALTVLDAREPTTVAVERLVDALVHAPETTTIVWGSDRPYGERVLGLVRERGIEIAGLASSEGIVPIFDLIVSRRA